MKNVVNIANYTSPVGEMIIGEYCGKVCLCDWDCAKNRQLIDNRIQKELSAIYEYRDSVTLKRVIRELNEYFAGARADFTVPILLTGSEFQKAVLSSLLKIGYGQTLTYSQMATLVDRPTAVRAVASAIASNPISLLVPCHRVIGHNGKLSGYRGGINAKEYLLNLEGLSPLIFY